MNRIHTVKQMANYLIKDGVTPPYSFLIYGYTEILLAKDEWLTYITENEYELLDDRPNSDALKRLHSRPDVEKIPTWACVQEIVFKKQITFNFFDFKTYEGSEIKVDLNYKIAEKYEKKYDAILDLGTSEHIFNYPQVLMNSHLMAKIGGYIFHSVPLNLPNHAFYNISPTLFFDFYSDNNSVPIECYGVYIIWKEGKHFWVKTEDMPHTRRFCLANFASGEMHLQYVVKKTNHSSEFIFPIQRYYR